jgi:hypothetical protein
VTCDCYVAQHGRLKLHLIYLVFEDVADANDADEALASVSNRKVTDAVFCHRRGPANVDMIRQIKGAGILKKAQRAKIAI